MIRFKDYIVIEYKNNCSFIYKGTELYEIEDDSKYYFKLFSKKNWEISELSNEEYSFLTENKLVIEDYDINNVKERYSRNLYYYENRIDNIEVTPLEINKQIEELKVVIVGCGGLGTVVIQNLILMGVKNYLLIDFDTINYDNLNRQLFFKTEDIGKYKVDILQKNIKKFNHSCEVDIKKCKIENLNMLKETIGSRKIDFIINCADYPNEIFDIITEYSFRYDIPAITGSVGMDTGNWGPIVDKNYIKNKYKSPTETKSLKGSISTTNMIIGTFMANDILEYFIDNKDKKLFKKKYLNFRNMSIEIEE